MKKTVICWLLTILIICTMLPVSLSAAETGKLTSVEFDPSDMHNDTFVALTASKGTQGEDPVFTLDSQNDITVTAKNGALIQEVYLTEYEGSSQAGYIAHGALSVAVCMVVAFGHDTSAGDTPSSTVSSNKGQTLKHNGYYSVTGINADSVVINATDGHGFSLITVVYSLDLTKQEIIDAINEKGTAFKAEIDNYKKAVSTFKEAEKVFEQPKATKEAYEQAKAEWEKTQSDYLDLVNRLESAESQLKAVKESYPAVRDSYLALRARAQVLEMTESQGLPPEIAEDESLSSLFAAPDPLSLPVPTATTERSFDESCIDTETDCITISASKNLEGEMALQINKPITITDSQGEIIHVYLVKTSSAQVNDRGVNVITSSGKFYNNNTSKGTSFAIYNVDASDLTMNLDIKSSPNLLHGLPLSSIIVKYTRPMIENEVIEALKEKGPEYEEAQKHVLGGLQALEAAEKACNDFSASLDAANEKWAQAQTKWDSEKEAYGSAEKVFEAAKTVFTQAEEKYIAVRDDYMGFYAAGKKDLAALNKEAGLSEDEGLPQLITEEELNTASVLSQGNIWILSAVAAAVIAITAIIIVKRKSAVKS